MTPTFRFHLRASFVLLLVVGLLGMVFRGPQKSLNVLSRSSSDRNILRVACTQAMALDPQRRDYPLAQYNQLILCLWEPLVECDPVTGQPKPAAAESWIWSPDLLTLTITLRNDSYWSNGDPVVAQDFVRSWLHLLKKNAEGAEVLAPLKNARAYQHNKLAAGEEVGAHAVDDHTLRIELDKVRSTLLMELADPLLSPLYRTSEEILAKKTYFKNPALLVTNGPFRLVMANSDGYRLAASKYYHDSTSVRLTGVQFIMADGLGIAQLMLAAGVVDFLAPTPSGETREMPTDRHFSLESELEPTINSIDFNVAHQPLSDVRVRQALALALDRIDPIKRYDPGHMIPAWSWVPEMPGRTGLTLLKEDAGQARQLLAEAGYPGGRGFPVLRMALPMMPRPNQFALAWTERWFRELGVRTYVTYEYEKKHMARRRSGDYDVLYNRLTATVPDAGDLLGTFLWPSDFNGTNWHDEEVAGLLAEANTRTGAEHLALLEKAERRVMTELPSVPMMFEVRQTMLAAEVRGWYSDPLCRQNFKRFYLEPDS